MAKKEKNEFGEEQKKVDTSLIKCDSCGSNMVFDPDSQMLFCEHCGTKKEFPKVGVAKEIDIRDGFNADKNNWSADETVVFHCSNCGAKVVLNKTETAKSCPFCGTAHVEKTDELAGIKPNGLIPFVFGKNKASEFAKKWARKRIFAPRRFKKSLSAENINGVYTPCFTFDSITSSVYDGKVGTTHTRVVGSGKNARTETYVVWRHISGVYYDNFDDILVTAGSKFDQKRLNKISPFDTNHSSGYMENYLLGFSAYHYDREIVDCWGSAKGIMDAEIKNRILKQYPHDKVAYFNVSTTHERVTYKYVMLPVYIGNFNYKEKTYNFFVNGESGKTGGKTPVSFWRVLIACLLGAAIIAGIVALVLMN